MPSETARRRPVYNGRLELVLAGAPYTEGGRRRGWGRDEGRRVDVRTKVLEGRDRRSCGDAYPNPSQPQHPPPSESELEDRPLTGHPWCPSSKSQSITSLRPSTTSQAIREGPPSTSTARIDVRVCAHGSAASGQHALMHDAETQPVIRGEGNQVREGGGEGNQVREGGEGAGRSIQGRRNPSAPLRSAGTHASHLRPQDTPDGRSAVPSLRARTGTTADTGSDVFEEPTVDCGLWTAVSPRRC